MAGRRGECLENREIGRVLDVHDPALDLCLVVLIEADVSQRLLHLGALVIDPMWLPYKRDNGVSPGRFAKNHFRVAGGDNL